MDQVVRQRTRLMAFGMATVPRTSPRITIVEDDLALLHALKFALEADGYLVTAYAAGEPVLQRPSEADCLVIDQNLPDMPGLTLIERLRAIGPQPPAILITTNPDARCRRAAAGAGVPIVEKPLMSGELRQRIAEAVGSARPATES